MGTPTMSDVVAPDASYVSPAQPPHISRMKNNTDKIWQRYQDVNEIIAAGNNGTPDLNIEYSDPIDTKMEQFDYEPIKNWEESEFNRSFQNNGSIHQPRGEPIAQPRGEPILQQYEEIPPPNAGLHVPIRGEPISYNFQ